MSRRVLVLAGWIWISFPGSPAHADKLRINAGFWPGERTSELEERYLLDDLVGVNARLDLLPWDGRTTYTIYPLGLEYLRPMGAGQLVIGANMIIYRPEYRYTGVGLGFNSVSFVSLDDYHTYDGELQAGCQIPLAPHLFVTPKVGFRQNYTRFQYNDLTIGSNISITADSDFVAQSRNMSIGISGRFILSAPWSLVFEYMMASPLLAAWGGSMTDKRLQVGTNAIAYSRARSDFESRTYRWMLGAQYDVSETVHLQFGLREETQTVSYPGYFDLPLSISTTGPGAGNASLQLSVTELITDLVFYNLEESSTKGYAFVAFSLDL